ncbi:MAG TPA: flippase [Candidatus Magasanikbacteria bacterium]|nr:flippase [Candidatus Magasanikbacteria bacterium]
MSQTKQIYQNTLIQLVGKIISTLLGLAAVAIMTRSLGVEKFGWYATATGFLQFIGIFCDFGFTVVSANMLSRPDFDKKSLFNNLFTLRFITAILFQGLLPFSILLFPYPIEIKLAVAIIALSFINTSINQVFIASLQTKLQMHLQSIGEIIGRVVLILGALLVAKNNFGFLPMMAVITLASFFYTGYLWYKSEKIKFQFDKEISKAIFIQMWPTALAVIFNAIYLQGDRVLLPLFVPQTDVAFYGAAYRVLDIVIQVCSMIMGIMTPLLAFAWSRKLAEDFKKNAQLSFDLLMTLLIPMVCGIFVLAEPIMSFVAGNDFSGAGKILRILIISIFGVCFGMVFGHLALAINRQKQVFWIYFSDAILSVIGYLIFIPKFGMYGAAYVTIFSEFYAGILLLITAFYYSRFFPKFFTFFKITLLSLLMSVLLYNLREEPILILISLSGLFYTLGAIALKIFSRDSLIQLIPFKK